MSEKTAEAIFEEEGANAGFMRFGGSEEESSKESEELGEETGETEMIEDEDGLEREEESDEEEEEPGDDDETSEVETELFGDIKIPKELAPIKNQLLANYSRKMREIATIRTKAQLVDAIEEDPEVTLLELADRFGINFGGQEEGPKEFDIGEIPEPAKDESMSAYMKRVLTLKAPEIAKSFAEKPKAPRRKGRLALQGSKEEVEASVQASMAYLTREHSDWTLYEDDLVEIVSAHPTMARDAKGLDLLYEMAKTKATGDMRKAAKKRMKGLSDKAKKTVRTGERSTRPAITTQKGKKVTFGEAWDMAKRDASK